MEAHTKRVRYNAESGRGRILNEGTQGKGPIVYLMSRDQRVIDNHALDRAVQLSKSFKRPLKILFIVTLMKPTIQRHYQFMMEGIYEIGKYCAQNNLSFDIRKGEDYIDRAIQYFRDCDPHWIVMDFSPLPFGRNWRETIASKVDCMVEEVDSHNVVPCWLASPKREIGARTMRPKLWNVADQYLKDDYIPLDLPATAIKDTFEEDYKEIMEWLSSKWDTSIGPIVWKGGYSEGMKALKGFTKRLANYDTDRNDPCKRGISDLSPYLHFGQISPLRCILTCKSSKAFVEECWIRRELSDNFCYYTPKLDFSCISEWARDSLAAHEKDPRPHLYTYEELLAGKTDDPLWNAGQLQMVKTGKMHGYVRMYWAKQFLLWTKNAKQAYEWCLRMNDLYSIDGRDPNGYVGVLWSLGGIHDRGWTEREIFGKIRCMNRNTYKKFNAKAYIAKWTQAGHGFR